MPNFATLGPEGSNHHWVAQRYLAFHDLVAARIALFEDFDAAFAALLAGQANFVLQVAVHPSVTDTVARLRGRAHLVDAFLSPSQPMAVLTRSAVTAPKSLGLQMATRNYVDTSRWERLVPEASTVAVAEGLREGRYDSGITLLRYARERPDELRLDETIGTVVDPWLVYGREPVAADEMVVWRDSPASKLYRDMS